jgi:hypothetical protein
VNNLLYQNKTPLFVSLGDSGGGSSAVGQSMTGGSGCSSGTGRDESENRHFIPEKFSDLFRDLAVPAGLFMMPAQFKPRNYAFEVPDRDTAEVNRKREGEDSETDTDDEGRTKQVPNDIFDTLLALVTPAERIQHDVKTRRRRSRETVNDNKEKKKQNKTRRSGRSL